MLTVSYYLVTGTTIINDTDENFERLRDQVEGYLDCDESFVVERVEQRVHDKRQTRTAYVIPPRAVATVKIQERIEVHDPEGGPTTQDPPHATSSSSSIDTSPDQEGK